MTRQQEIAIYSRFIAFEFIYIRDLAVRFSSDPDALDSIETYRLAVLKELDEIRTHIGDQSQEMHEAVKENVNRLTTALKGRLMGQAGRLQ